jgi:hypothetical protein
MYTTIGLSALTSGEVDQLENIGTTTISPSTWGYLGGVDQNVHSGANSTFNDITVLGTVDGIDIATQDAKLETLYTTIGLSALTSGEVDQLENIGATTISATQWGFLGAMDQDVNVGGNVAFHSAIIDSTGTEAFLVRKDSDGGDVLVVDTTNSVVAVSGDITVSGTVDGIDIATQDAKLETLYTTIGLSELTSGEVDQLENIGGTTISSSTWGYLGGVDQSLNNGANATFGILTVTGTVDGIDIATQDVKLETLYTTIGLSALTSGEVDQLENIGTTTISPSTWGYLGGVDQNVHSGANSTFNDITVLGTVDGIDIATQDAKLETLYTTIGLSALTSGEVDQLENIGATTISATQWGFLGAMDQDVNVGGNVAFHSAIIDSTGTEAFLIRKDSDGGDVFTVDTTNSQVLINGINITPITGDILNTSFSGANNQSSATNVSGLLFAEASVKSFLIIATVSVGATADLYQQFEIRGLQKATGIWIITDIRLGDDTDIEFSILSTGGNGQLQYTSADYTGFSSLDITFRALVN